MDDATEVNQTLLTNTFNKPVDSTLCLTILTPVREDLATSTNKKLLPL